MGKKTIYIELLKEEKELQDTLDKVRGLIKHYAESYDLDVQTQKKLDFVEPEHNSIAFKEGYDENWNLEDKALYVMKLIGKGLASDHAEKWITVDSSLSLKRAKYLSRKHLSKLFNDGKIGATKVGVKNRYFIKE